MTNTDLTIIITTFKSEDKIDTCLNSIGNDIRVIVIENSNNQKFKNYIENKYQNVECELTKENLGYGKANNKGLKKVKTRYSLILNPDTILKKKSIDNFFSFIKKKIDFAILGPAQNKLILDKTSSDLIEVESVKGFAIFLNMEKFSNIGFFDENIFLYLEEIDLCKRIRNINEKIYVDQSIKIFHDGGKSVNEKFSNKIELLRNWHWMWSLFYYNRKHFNFFYALILVSPKFISALIKIIFYKLIVNDKKNKIYSERLNGLINSILGRSSWYRPTLD
jgi:N-acetylglucosaminyl-diphospho-decaprenol L-rhamnosyltransferase